MSRPRFAFAVGVAAAFLLQPSSFRLSGALSLSASQQQPPIRVGTTLVTVDVYPTREGMPVEGLTAEDFEIREDGQVQTIESFEFVRIEPPAVDDEIRDPNNQREMEARIADPKSRLFVLFLDRAHVGIDGSHRSRRPILDMLRTTLAPSDLFGVMTSRTDVRTLAFSRSLASIEAELTRHWEWGDADKPYLDEVEEALEDCYAAGRRELLGELIARRREDLVFTALEDLVAHLEGLREGRKVVFLFGSGWTLFEPSTTIPAALARAGGGMAAPPVGIGPDGRLRMGGALGEPNFFGCDAEANRLAQLRHGQRFRDLIRAAGQANVAFYPVELVGVGASSRRVDQFRSLASETDGQAVTMTNDLAAGMARATQHLSSFYLLGYTPTNTRADGRMRRIDVRLKQPGIDVRARRGYRALTEEELLSMNAAAAAPPPSPVESAARTAFGRLAQIHDEVRMYVHGIVRPSAAGDASRVWITGEIDLATARKQWADGAAIDLTVGSAPHEVTATARLEPGARVWTAEVELPEPPTGNLPIRARLTAAGGTAALTGAGATHADRPEAILFRRGQITGNRYVPAADRRFSRTERIRLEVPVDRSARAADARLLDVNARPLSVPVTLTERADEAGDIKWIVAEVVLAPLGAGDYVVQIEVEGDPTPVLTAIRVTR
jgi:VWFA-related protein